MCSNILAARSWSGKIYVLVECWLFDKRVVEAWDKRREIIKNHKMQHESTVQWTNFIVCNTQFHFSFLWVRTSLFPLAGCCTSSTSKNNPQACSTTYFVRCLHWQQMFSTGRWAAHALSANCQLAAATELKFQFQPTCVSKLTPEFSMRLQMKGVVLKALDQSQTWCLCAPAEFYKQR